MKIWARVLCCYVFTTGSVDSFASTDDYVCTAKINTQVVAEFRLDGAGNVARIDKNKLAICSHLPVTDSTPEALYCEIRVDGHNPTISIATWGVSYLEVAYLEDNMRYATVCKPG